MRAYDFDGTITVLPSYDLVEDGRHTKLHPPFTKGGYCINPDLDVSDVQIVLTGNPLGVKPALQRVLKAIGCPPSVLVICNPNHRFDYEYLANWKAFVMRGLKITEYVDDDQAFNEVLKKVWDGRIMSVKDTRRGKLWTKERKTLLK